MLPDRDDLGKTFIGEEGGGDADQIPDIELHPAVREQNTKSLEEKVFEICPTIIKKGQNVSIKGEYDKLEIYDATGRLVSSYSKDMKRYGLVPDFSCLPSGVYFFDAVLNDKKKNGKLVVVK